MDLKSLKAEIERKKRQLEKNNDIMAPNKKYFKRGDLAAKQEDEYWKRHKQLSKDQQTSSQVVVNKEDNKTKDKEEKVPQLPRKEVIRRLRERNEPIRLFGENDYEAFQRLKKLEMLEPDIKKGEGYENDFKAAMDRVDQEFINEIINAGSGQSSNNVAVRDDGTTEEDIKKMSDEIGKNGSDRDQEIILRFLKFILKKWGDDLNCRDEDNKRSRTGKEASAIHAQTVSYLKPLFRSLKHKTIDVDILECLVDILKFLMDRDYIKANDAYLEMAIGNAPWPIGVTMVGIHARTGREKISSRNVAHVLNDETQRKYIQALKRLMTQCQRIFPTDPSRSVDYKKDLTV
ncbi:pre-mRNA-splicing factor 18-like [Ylistrum balloti]|uniref:pre-mRNA-splicing factor 18-like n=1 Tax=Ylistrum balloti TaxID=509963 RepID=UPI002905ECC9|nr:pre-mRNA-splicing factor 18-like [Ylistrum balloti]